jgi:hypothetical protein
MVTSCQHIAIRNSGRSLFICVDGTYEPVHGSQGQRDAGHLYHVEAVCGSYYAVSSLCKL